MFKKEWVGANKSTFLHFTLKKKNILKMLQRKAFEKAVAANHNTFFSSIVESTEVPFDTSLLQASGCRVFFEGHFLLSLKETTPKLLQAEYVFLNVHCLELNSQEQS